MVGSFSEINLTGLGLFSIDPGVIDGASDSGTIRVFYNFADSTPGTIDAPFLVQVLAPEPGTGWILLAGALLAIGLRAARRRFRFRPAG